MGSQDGVQTVRNNLTALQIQKSIPLKDQKSFNTERQWKDYCYRILGFICLEMRKRDCGMWKVDWLFCFYSFFFFF